MQTMPISLYDDYVCRRMKEQRADAEKRRTRLRLKRALRSH
jgi:hypothetical protein